MIVAWIIGIHGLSVAVSVLQFLREGKIPDVQALVRGLKDASEPLVALEQLVESARLRSLGEAAAIAFPLCVGKLILSVLLVISSGMAMSGRPGSRLLAMQALLASAALSIASFWLLRDARYASIDVIVSVRDLLPKLLANEPPQILELWTAILDKPVLLSLSRMSLILLDVGALLMGAVALTTNKTKAFFDAVAEEAEEAEDP